MLPVGRQVRGLPPPRGRGNDHRSTSGSPATVPFAESLGAPVDGASAAPAAVGGLGADAVPAVAVHVVAADDFASRVLDTDELLAGKKHAADPAKKDESGFSEYWEENLFLSVQVVIVWVLNGVG